MYRMFITTFGWFNIVKVGKYTRSHGSYGWCSELTGYHEVVHDHFNNPRNVGSLDKEESWRSRTVSMVGHPTFFPCILLIGLWLFVFLMVNHKVNIHHTVHIGGGFKYFVAMMTNIFQMGWNHQPDIHPTSMAKRWGPITFPPTFQDNDVGSALVGKASCGDVIKLQAWRFRSKMI